MREVGLVLIAAALSYSLLLIGLELIEAPEWTFAVFGLAAAGFWIGGVALCFFGRKP